MQNHDNTAEDEVGILVPVLTSRLIKLRRWFKDDTYDYTISIKKWAVMTRALNCVLIPYYMKWYSNYVFGRRQIIVIYYRPNAVGILLKKLSISFNF